MKRKRKCGIYTQWNYSAFKKKEILPCMTKWVGLEDIILNEISQSQKDKYWIFYLYEVSKIVKCTESERRVVVRSWGR